MGYLIAFCVLAIGFLVYNWKSILVYLSLTTLVLIAYIAVFAVILIVVAYIASLISEKFGRIFNSFLRIFSGERLALDLFSLPLFRSGPRNVFRSTVQEAMAAAADRKDYILKSLERGGASRLVIERPVGEALSLPSTEDQSIVQAVTWEIERDGGDPELLLGRATDAVLAILFDRHKDARFASQPLEKISQEVPSVGLRRLGAADVKDGEYPWIVVIGVASRRFEETFWRPHLLELKSWIGIGVEFVTSRGAVHFGQPWHSDCAGLNEGVMVGLLRNSDSASQDLYGLTCSHVAPQTCTCIVVRGSHGISSRLPDAALIAIGDYDTSNGGRPTDEVRPASTLALTNAVKSEAEVRRRGGGSRAYPGRIVARERLFRISGHVCHFPAARVKLVRRRHLFIVLPFFRKRFADPGDSGAWVFLSDGERPAQWVGLVQGGDDTDVYVTEAAMLLKFLERKLGTRNGALKAYC